MFVSFLLISYKFLHIKMWISQNLDFKQGGYNLNIKKLSRGEFNMIHKKELNHINFRLWITTICLIIVLIFTIIFQ